MQFHNSFYALDFVRDQRTNDIENDSREAELHSTVGPRPPEYGLGRWWGRLRRFLGEAARSV